MSYSIDGNQYIATMISGSLKYDRPGTLLVFSGGTDELTMPPLRDLLYLNRRLSKLIRKPSPRAIVSTTNIALYAIGLGQLSIVATAVPDLRRMSATPKQFTAVVLGGSKKSLGCPVSREP